MRLDGRASTAPICFRQAYPRNSVLEEICPGDASSALLRVRPGMRELQELQHDCFLRTRLKVGKLDRGVQDIAHYCAHCNEFVVLMRQHASGLTQVEFAAVIAPAKQKRV